MTCAVRYAMNVFAVGRREGHFSKKPLPRKQPFPAAALLRPSQRAGGAQAGAGGAVKLALVGAAAEPQLKILQGLHIGAVDK